MPVCHVVLRLDPTCWPTPQQDNYITGVVCSSITGLLLVVYVLRGLWFRFRRLRWDHRRHRSYWLKVVELSALLVNLAVWTYGNDVRKMEQADCSKRNSTILWTYAVRITMSNILLCMWIIAVRGLGAREWLREGHAAWQPGEAHRSTILLAGGPHRYAAALHCAVQTSDTLGTMTHGKALKRRLLFADSPALGLHGHPDLSFHFPGLPAPNRFAA